MEKENGGVGKDRSVIHMKETMRRIRRMGMEYSIGQVETYTRESIERMKEMASER